MGPADSRRIPRAPRYSGSHSGFSKKSCTGLSPSPISLSKVFHFLAFLPFIVVLLPRCCLNNTGLGSSAFARHYLRNHSYFLLLWVLRCFSSPRSPPSFGMSGLPPDGLPHSDIRGSKIICISPRLFAAYHVLHRLREPRHPPSALSYFLLSTLPLHEGLSSPPRNRRIDISSVCSSRYSILRCPACQRSLRDSYEPLRGEFIMIGSYSVAYPYILITFVENNGFEPLTLCLQSRCSSQLS